MREKIIEVKTFGHLLRIDHEKAKKLKSEQLEIHQQFSFVTTFVKFRYKSLPLHYNDLALHALVSWRPHPPSPKTGRGINASGHLTAI